MSVSFIIPLAAAVLQLALIHGSVSVPQPPVAVPEVKVPRVIVPEVVAPKVNLPEAKIPEAKTPEATVPKPSSGESPSVAPVPAIKTPGVEVTPKGIKIPESGVEVSPEGIKLPGIEISPERIKAPGVEVSKEKIIAPGIEISAEGVKAPVVEITPDKITVGGGQIVVGIGGALINTPNVKVRVGDSEVSVDQEGTKVVLNSGGVSVETNESVKIEQGSISIVTTEGEVRIGVLPDEVKTLPAIQAQRIEKLELTVDSDKVIYRVRGKERRRLFGFIPLSMTVTTAVNAENGAIEEVGTPWWRIFTR